VVSSSFMSESSLRPRHSSLSASESLGETASHVGEPLNGMPTLPRRLSAFVEGYTEAKHENLFVQTHQVMTQREPSDHLVLRVAARYAAKQVGTVGVDSGTLLVIDPAYLRHWGTGEHPDLTDDGYRRACKAGRHQLYFTNGVPAAVFIKGFGGDGNYPVTIDEDPESRPPVASFKVDFQGLVAKVAAKYRALTR